MLSLPALLTAQLTIPGRACTGSDDVAAITRSQVMNSFIIVVAHMQNGTTTFLNLLFPCSMSLVGDHMLKCWGARAYARYLTRRRCSCSNPKSVRLN